MLILIYRPSCTETVRGGNRKLFYIVKQDEHQVSVHSGAVGNTKLLYTVEQLGTPS
jgi:hypothetical protein